MELKIAKLGGDGIGPEVINEAVKVCNAIAKKFNHRIFWSEAMVGADAIQKVGDPYPNQNSQHMLKFRCNFVWGHWRSKV